MVYTAAARAAAGGTDDAIRARIMLGVTETNTAYANSGVVQRLRLVGAELIGYTEGGDIGLDLERVTEAGDGFMDGIHARRDQLGADLVSLIVNNTTGSCGVAWLMQTPSVTFAPQAFSVTVYDCISPNYTFGHELGHNMGAAHAPDDPNLPAAYPYAYGYKDPASLFRTVMAYNCRTISCPRILYFSNPGVSYGGRPTGTALQHNNALALNNTRTIVANFRQSVTPGLGAPRSLTVTTSGTTAMFAWLPPTTGIATGYVIEAGSAPGLANLALLPTGAATSLVVPAVPPGLYFVRVRATNAEGVGAPSTEIQLSMTPQGRCTAPAGPPALESGDRVGQSRHAVVDRASHGRFGGLLRHWCRLLDGHAGRRAHRHRHQCDVVHHPGGVGPLFRARRRLESVRCRHAVERGDRHGGPGIARSAGRTRRRDRTRRRSDDHVGRPDVGRRAGVICAGGGHRHRRLEHRHCRDCGAVDDLCRAGHSRHLLRACARPEHRGIGPLGRLRVVVP